MIKDNVFIVPVSNPFGKFGKIKHTLTLPFIQYLKDKYKMFLLVYVVIRQMTFLEVTCQVEIVISKQLKETFIMYISPQMPSSYINLYPKCLLHDPDSIYQSYLPAAYPKIWPFCGYLSHKSIFWKIFQGEMFIKL